MSEKQIDAYGEELGRQKLEWNQYSFMSDDWIVVFRELMYSLTVFLKVKSHYWMYFSLTVNSPVPWYVTPWCVGDMQSYVLYVLLKKLLLYRMWC